MRYQKLRHSREAASLARKRLVASLGLLISGCDATATLMPDQSLHYPHERAHTETHAVMGKLSIARESNPNCSTEITGQNSSITKHTVTGYGRGARGTSPCSEFLSHSIKTNPEGAKFYVVPRRTGYIVLVSDQLDAQVLL